MKTLLLALLLAGCVTDPPKPVVGELRTVTIEVPVKVPCLTPGDLPKRPVSAMPDASADIGRKAAGAVADARAYAAYADQMDAAAKACIGGPQ